MSERIDTLVIGAGVVGVCSAFYCAGRGNRVLVLERDEVASGASGGNAGLVDPSHSIPLAAPGALGRGFRWLLDPESPFRVKPRLDPGLPGWLWRFARSCRRRTVRRAIPVLRDLGRTSASLHRDLASLTGADWGYRRSGFTHIFATRRDFEHGRREASLLAEFGIASRTYGSPAYREIVPGAAEALAGAVHYPEDAQIDPGKFVRRLARLAAEKGVSFRPGTTVTGFRVKAGRIEAVRTSSDEFSPGQVVLAAGAWSGRLARQLGLNLAIQPARGFSITLRGPRMTVPMPLLLRESRIAVTPLNGSLRLAGTLELVGFEPGISVRRLDAIRNAVPAYLGNLGPADSEETWAGFRPLTPDGMPVIGRPDGIRNLVVAAGHGMLGMTLGPVTGQIVARLANDYKPDFDLSLLSPNRF